MTKQMCVVLVLLVACIAGIIVFGENNQDKAGMGIVLAVLTAGIFLRSEWGYNFVTRLFAPSRDN